MTSGSAIASTSSSVFTGMNVMPFVTSAGRSSTSIMFCSGSTNVVTPMRRAASDFSRMPPTGSTSPDSVISPVIATSARTF